MGFAEISGFYSGLAHGFVELGVRCTLVDLGSHRFAYARPPRPALVRAVEAVSARRAGGGASATAWLPAALVLRFALFAWAVLRHDVFVFGAGTSFFQLRELRLLKAMRKTVIFQFHGSDARPPYIDGAVVAGDSPAELTDVIARARTMKQRLRRIDRHADHVINNPTHAHLHERPVVVWLRVGLPNRPPLGAAPGRDEGPVRVLHCPSDLRAKGTHEIRAMLDRLRQSGVALDYVEITDQPHDVVLSELARCDLVVDQLYADYAMPGFATEAAWCGKPVLIGGFPVKFWDEVLPPEARPPTAFCEPGDFEAELRRLVTDAPARTDLGARAREFVESRWRPGQVAERYLRLAAGDCPPGWLYDLSKLDYLHGCGLSEEQSRAIVAGVLERGGPAALQLEDKPALQAAFVRYAR